MAHQCPLDRLSLSGKRAQYFFPTRAKAKEARAKFLEQYTKHGSSASTISPALAEDAARAAEILKPWELTLTAAARLVAELRAKDAESRPTNKACGEWLEMKAAEVRPKTLESYRSAANKLADAFKSRRLSKITTNDLQKVLVPPGTSPSSARANRNAARVFWFWCAEQGWCDPKPIQGVTVPKKRDEGEIEILPVEDAARLLEAAQRFFPQSVSMFAVSLFGGVRAEELTKLRPEDFTDAGIELSARITKKGRRRNIEPSPTLRAWLEAYPFQRCPNWARISRAVRHLAGFETWIEDGFLPEDLEPLASPPKPWPQNAMRHSYASYAVAAGIPLETLLWEFGHTGSPAVLRSHYVGRASKRDALIYFSLRPGGQREASKPSIVKSA